MELDKNCNNLNNIEQLDSDLSATQTLDSELENFIAVEKRYTGIDGDNISVEVNQSQSTISATLKQVQYDSKDNFPEIGSDRLIYVDLSDNSLWIYRDGEYVSASADLSDLLDTKVSKVEYSKNQTFPDGSDAGVIGRAYIRFRDNTDNSIVLNCQNAKYTIPVRDGTGNFYVGNPTQLYHTANKIYVDDKFNGANKAVSFVNYSAMISSLNTIPNNNYNVGQNIMIVTLQVPDLWVSEITDESVAYTYVSDDDFINELTTNGSVQVGYYKLSALETQKVDLTEYVKNTDYAIDNGQAGIVKTIGTTYGVRTGANGLLFIDGASKPQILDKGSAYRPITPSTIDYAVKVGLTTNQEEWSEEEKASARDLLGVTTGGGLNIADLPKFTNKLYINMANATSLAGVLTLPIASSSNFVVDWGDGTTTDYVETVTEISHTYSDRYFLGWVYIYGDWKGFNFALTADNNKKCIIKIMYDDSITTLSNYSHANLVNLDEIKLSRNLTTLPSACFWNCSSLKYVELPQILTSIVSNAFYRCSNLLSADIPDSVTTTQQGCFQSCSKLKTVKVSENLTALAVSAFNSCSVLEYIKLPSSLTNIGTSALTQCGKLHTIEFKGATPPTLASSSLQSTLTNIIVPSSALRAYKVKTNFVEFANKIYPKGGTYSETITIPVSSWSISTNTVTVEAVGSTTEDRNIITWNVSSNGVPVENTYGLKCTAQGTMSLTFSCETIPTEDVEVSVRYMLTNY